MISNIEKTARPGQSLADMIAAVYITHFRCDVYRRPETEPVITGSFKLDGTECLRFVMTRYVYPMILAQKRALDAGLKYKHFFIEVQTHPDGLVEVNLYEHSRHSEASQKTSSVESEG